MRKYVITGLVFLAVLGLNAQEAKVNVKKGDILEIVKPSSSDFKYVLFPRKNFIIKRGGITSNQLVNGEEVVVTEVTKQKDGSTKVLIKQTDGGWFYKAIPSVAVRFEEAINSGEIKISKKTACI